ncbi:uncharacterized protein LOC124301588 isoform X2 [Neodiprion virginianus]|uniref:uncharacterized protein LOC124301588 isoform X2 n=1 Tax=Neodiprion virginianus TaxID=2961670 RepID=UPI001EE69AC2|nr:uncharacterized protein LOC124301588 isoform X2 [Neodiprion virginianus]
MSIARGVTQLGSRVNQLKEQIFSPKNLFYTNIAISVSLSGVGDILEQHYEILQGTWEKWSPVRTSHMAISGSGCYTIIPYLLAMTCIPARLNTTNQ